MKSCEKFDLLFMHIQCATAYSLEKVNLKFKLLYLRNYVSYFNTICSICCVNTHIQRLKVWLKSLLSWLKYSNFFLGDCFFIGAPCILYKSDSLIVRVCYEREARYTGHNRAIVIIVARSFGDRSRDVAKITK